MPYSSDGDPHDADRLPETRIEAEPGTPHSPFVTHRRALRRSLYVYAPRPEARM